jgi:hypothetical protein
MSGDKAALMLVDRLTDVLLLRASGNYLDMAHSSSESALERMDKRMDDFEMRKKKYYALLAEWVKNKGLEGDKPKKSAELERYEAGMRLAQAQSAPKGGFTPRFP